MKNKIPTHDPHTGELNPHYEELTGDKNPFLLENNGKDNCFDLSTLIGKEFKHRGKYGLSVWTDKVKNVESKLSMHTNFNFIEILKNPNKEVENPVKFEFFGHSIGLYVRSTRGNQLYKLKNCIFVEKI
jgi:hypothetical protein